MLCLDKRREILHIEADDPADIIFSPDLPISENVNDILVRAKLDDIEDFIEHLTLYAGIVFFDFAHGVSAQHSSVDLRIIMRYRDDFERTFFSVFSVHHLEHHSKRTISQRFRIDLPVAVFFCNEIHYLFEFHIPLMHTGSPGKPHILFQPERT